MRELLVIIPVSNIARLLNDYNFTSTVQKTFNWLNSQVEQTKKLLLSATREDSAAIADSSSTTIEPSPVDQPKKSRKRKRDGAQTSSFTRTNLENDSERLYVSICSVTGQLDTLIGASPEGQLNFATEHLRSAFRSSPEQAAEILGSALTVTRLFIGNERSSTILGDSARSLEFDDRNQYIRDIGHIHEACFRAVANIWDSRSVTSDDSLDQLSVVRIPRYTPSHYC